MKLLLAISLLGIAVSADDGPVTCGSVVKLLANREQVRLHSHDVKYGSGSGQQSVTGMPDSDDVNSHWDIRPSLKGNCRRGTPIECGQVIRLKHQTTGCLLHSHHFSSPLSSNQEISCFGKDGEGDTGDNWQVLCNTDVWLRGELVKLKHEDTGAYLGTSGQQYGRPIAGQKEIVGLSSPNAGSEWRTAEGIYMMPSDE
uniref:MIR domain-containing protein n=1 Tax=Plectus sambesii TaxID=2011161 RepID=A0A914UMY4_9BILA